MCQVEEISWRGSTTSNRSDTILYTITADYTVRIYMPVLDSADHLQLHASLDLYSFGVSGIISRICLLDLDAVVDSLGKAMERPIEGSPQEEEEEKARRTRLKSIIDEGWDLFAVVTQDGTVVVRNIDRRPPTLLHQFATLHSPPQTLLPSIRGFALCYEPSSSSAFIITAPRLHSYIVSPLSFFDAQVGGVRRLSVDEAGRGSIEKIQRFVRTASGLALGACYESGGGEVWRRHPDKGIVRIGRWASGNIAVVLSEGRAVISYTKTSRTLTLYHLLSDSTIDYNVPDIDSLIVLKDSGTQASILAITTHRSVIQIRSILPSDHLPMKLNVLGPTPFPGPTSKEIPALILPVDPMGWSFTLDTLQAAHDSLLSISHSGVLEFWTLSGDGEWRATGQVHTERTSIKLAKCSTAKKSALVATTAEGKEELTIWDHKESEFASGLEYVRILNEPITDLDWTSTAAPQSQSILAIGFAQHVVLLCQQRLTYFDDETAWVEIGKVETSQSVFYDSLSVTSPDPKSRLIPYHISDSIWLAGGLLLVGAGHQMLLYDNSEEPTPLNNKPREQHSGNLFEIVSSHNGPLEDHHPQMLLQCLLWGKIDLVKEIIVRLAASFDAAEGAGSDSLYFTKLSAWQFLNGSSVYEFNAINFASSDDPHSFSRRLVERLLQKLEQQRLPHLSETEQAHLIVMIQTTLEIDEQRRALDANGLRYLISIRSFYTLNKRLETFGDSGKQNGIASTRAGKRERLRYRDIVWAFHSESQQIMMDASTEACGGRMTWSDAKALGVFLWTRSSEDLVRKVKLVHGLWRQAAWHKDHPLMVKFLSNDFKEPRWRTAALKNAFALLGKQRFGERIYSERWNLVKPLAEFAAAFFMLGGSLQDAVNVCIKQLNDFQLAIALARVVEGDSGQVLRGILTKIVVPLAFKEGNRWLGSWAFWMLDRRDLAVRILLTPLGQLASSLQGDFTINEIGNPHFDDPSLALLFAQLKSKSLQTVKGVNEISGQTEFNFVLQMARVFCRMGCHPLALAITTSWSFDRPTLPTQGAVRRNSSVSSAPSSPTLSRRGEIQPRPRNHTRRKSLIMDMDISALPPTRTVSPVPEVPTPLPSETGAPKGGPLSTPKESDAIQPRKTGIGSLMQAAKQEVKVPEFDMGVPVSSVHHRNLLVTTRGTNGANGTGTTPCSSWHFMNTSVPQYFATGVPEPGHHPAQHEYYTGPPMPPPPPLPEPPGTSNVSLDPMLQQPPQPQSQPQPPQNQTHDQGSEAIINAAKAERTAQDRERGRLRVQRFRMKRKLADVDAGRRDKDTLKKIKFPSTIAQEGESNGAGPSTPRKVSGVKDTEAELRERERGRLRVQAYRMRKKMAEAKEGIRDVTTLKKIRTVKSGTVRIHMPIWYRPVLNLMFNVSVETQPMLPPPPLHQTAIPDQTEAQSTVDISQPPSSSPTASTTTSPRQRAVRTNWFHPSRWSTINAAGLRANFSSAHEIVRLAKLAPGGEDIFKTLDRGTVHKWIDKERGGWSESVLEKVRKAAVKEAESWDAARIDDIVKPDNPSVFEGGLMSLDESGQEDRESMHKLFVLAAMEVKGLDCHALIVDSGTIKLVTSSIHTSSAAYISNTQSASHFTAALGVNVPPNSNSAGSTQLLVLRFEVVDIELSQHALVDIATRLELMMWGPRGRVPVPVTHSHLK
ncbi:WD repeat-containing protein [Rhizoctonia solani AG-1 IA]|uniref:WD repeat-containing protein n=1 Tax=Thanatephorus cucumeris (strain AG1-IA) TaxID=983506 RepID=L8WSU8_THACA|nr:WD repeat-containing protein [Rhizoctonia solani AG-1 IA]